jgi:hypothetical protein
VIYAKTGSRSQQVSSDGASYRTLRQSTPLAVHPSLRISAFTRASGKRLDEFVLGLELENMHRDAVVELEHVSAVGRRWEMVTLDEEERWAPLRTIHVALNDNRHFSSLGEPPMAAQEVRVLYLKLRKRPPSRQDGESIPLFQSIVSLDGTPPIVDHLFGEPFLFPARQQWRLANLSERYSDTAKPAICSLFPLYGIDDVDFVVSWRFSSLAVAGNHVVMGINLGFQEELLKTDPANLKLRERRDNPVRMLVQASNSMQHDFSRDPICTIPITVLLLNISDEVSANVDVRFPQRGLDWDPDRLVVFCGLKTQIAYPHVCNFRSGSGIEDAVEADWLGDHAAFRQLGPGASTTLNFSTGVVQPGSFDLGGCVITVDVEDPLESRRFVHRSTIPVTVIVQGLE